MAINERVGILTHVPGQDKPNPGLIGGIYGDYLTKELDFLDDSRNQPLASDFTSSAAYWFGTSTDPNGGGSWEDFYYTYRGWLNTYFVKQNNYWLSRSFRNELSFESIAIDPKPWTNQWNGSNQFEWIRRVVPSTVDGSFNYPYPEFPLAGDHNPFYNNRRALYHHYQRQNLGSLSDMATSALYQTGDSWLLDRYAPVVTNINQDYLFGSAVDGSINLIRRLSNGKILLAGHILGFDGVNLQIDGGKPSVIRLNIDGTLDTSFNAIQITQYSGVFEMDIDSDGKILLVGNALKPIDSPSFFTYDENQAIDIIRLNSDGTLDTDFIIGTGTTKTWVWDPTSSTNETYGFFVKSLEDGKILFGGEFSSFNGTTINSLVRLNNDGSVDDTFLFTGIEDLSPNHFEFIRRGYVYDDGRVLLGGAFNNANGATAGSLVRLNSDGSLDETFSVGLGFLTTQPNFIGTDIYVVPGEVTSFCVDSTGKILVSGYFNTFNDTVIDTNFLILNSDGTLDQTLPQLTYDGSTSIINSSAICGYPAWRIKSIDNKFVLIGEFKYYGTMDISDSIIVINSEGVVDSTYDFGQGLNSTAYDVISIGNTLVVVGGFSGYYTDGVSVNKIVAIKNDPIEHTASFLAEEYRSNRERMLWLLNAKEYRDLTTEEETELASRRAEFLATDHTKLQYSLWSGDKAKQIWSYYCNNGWVQRYIQDTPNSNVDTLDIWPADTTISEALGVTGSVTYNRLPAVQSVSFLPTTGNPGDLILVHEFDNMAWDPIRGMWSSALYYRFYEIILQSIRSQFNAKMQSSNELSLALRPTLFAGLYIPAFQLTTDGNINSELKTF